LLVTQAVPQRKTATATMMMTKQAMPPAAVLYLRWKVPYRD